MYEYRPPIQGVTAVLRSPAPIPEKQKLAFYQAALKAKRTGQAGSGNFTLQTRERVGQEPQSVPDPVQQASMGQTAAMIERQQQQDKTALERYNQAMERWRQEIELQEKKDRQERAIENQRKMEEQREKLRELGY